MSKDVGILVTGRRMKKKSPLYVAFNALMAIGAIDDSLHSQMWCFARAQQIANEAIRQLNTEHTSDIQKVLGIGGKR